MQNFIGLYLDTINALLTVRIQNASIFRKLPKHKNVWSPPQPFAIKRYVHNDNTKPLGNIVLDNMSFQTIAVKV